MSHGTTRLKSRPATRADIAAFFGKTPDQTVRARVLERDGEIVGVAGYWMAGGMAVMFSDARGDIPKLTIWREAKAMMQSMNIPALCIATEGSEPFLERLGWRYLGPSQDGGVYQWN
tara:strand:- start:444 stop:794 length:351 start_codon:yes stop_codon:yes gene_type:complete